MLQWDHNVRDVRREAEDAAVSMSGRAVCRSIISRPPGPWSCAMGGRRRPVFRLLLLLGMPGRSALLPTLLGARELIRFGGMSLAESPRFRNCTEGVADPHGPWDCVGKARNVWRRFGRRCLFVEL